MLPTMSRAWLAPIYSYSHMEASLQLKISKFQLQPQSQLAAH